MNRRDARRRLAAIVPLVCGMTLTLTGAAFATNYIQATSFGAGQLDVPVGVAVNQSSGDVYVGSLLEGEAPGKVNAFDESGNLLAPSSFGAGAPFYSGVAVNPTNSDLYVVEASASAAIQTYVPATGALLSEFAVTGAANLFEEFTAVQIASDAAGDVYLPSAPSNEVQVFSSTGGAPGGGVAATITGSGANALNAPTGVAVDPSGDVFVADDGNGRVEEFSKAGAFIKAIASPGAQSVALDSKGNVYVGDNTGSGFHIVVYNPTGTQTGEFGLGTIGTSEFETINTLAIDQRTGEIYVTDGGSGKIWVYAPVEPLKVTGESVSNLARLTATAKATINPGGEETHYYFEDSTSPLGTCPLSPAQTGTMLPSTSGAQSASEDLTGLTQNTVYHYRVVAYNASEVVCGADETFTTLTLPPLVLTGLASEVTATSAMLAGSVNPQGEGVSSSLYHFDYGANTSYGRQVGGEAGSTSTTIPVATVLAGLVPNTTYHYRLAAKNNSGLVNGEDATFTTLALPPAVSTGQAESVNDNSARLAGTVNPENQDTTYQAQYGPDTGYGQSAPTTPTDAGSGYSDIGVNVVLAGLAPGVTYHYRMLAVSAAGTSYGADRTFTTTGSAVTSTPFAGYAVPTTPLIAVIPIAFPTETTTTSPSKKKALTRAQKLAAALKACHNQPRKRRATCEKRARRSYGTATTKKAKK